MPHDKHGRLVEKGDVVICPSWDNNKQTLGVKKVANVFEGSETCNLAVFDFEPRYGQASVTAKESELVLKHDGSLPEAPPKAVT